MNAVAEQVQFSFGKTVLIALSMDDPAMQLAVGVKIAKSDRVKTVFTGDMESMSTLLDDIYSRATDAGGGWDQPKNWKVACKNAYESIRAALAKQGYTVRVIWTQGTERVVIERAELTK